MFVEVTIQMSCLFRFHRFQHQEWFKFSEKGVVLDLIRSATMGREEYYKQYPAQFVESPLGEKHATLPPIGERNGIADAGMTQDNNNYKFDRLVIINCRFDCKPCPTC